MISTSLPQEGLFVGRVWRPGLGPSVVTLRDGGLFDITSRTAPTLSHLLALPDPAAWALTAGGEDLGSMSDWEADSLASAQSRDGEGRRLLAPCDLQAVKAAGVTFARSMIERVIEERAGGDPARAETVRARVANAIGARLHDLAPGSAEAAEVKRILQAEGLWSPYLEVGIGPDAEIFTKAPPMAAVGWGAEIGLHPISTWNNPEPEVVLAVSPKGRVVGATLGNDVNLRDVEGRSALLLGKAKDNNASASIGPFLRLFDDTWSMDDVRGLKLSLRVEAAPVSAGGDGFVLDGASSMAEISRDPEDLVAQAMGRHHQYPDGMMLYLGTLFAPTQDRGEPGRGFTHLLGDQVTISAQGLGSLRNTVTHSTQAPEWVVGTAALFVMLSARQLI